MATRQNYRSARIPNNNMYVQGSVAEALERPVRTIDVKVIRNREKTKKWNLRNVLFFAAIFAIMAFSMMVYISAESNYTVATNEVASLEKELNSLTLSNNEELQRIEASINLEEIKRIAVEELGMTYATDGQVVLISDEGSDYVRQMEELPQN